jgi:hypothetical protein
MSAGGREERIHTVVCRLFAQPIRLFRLPSSRSCCGAKRAAARKSGIASRRVLEVLPMTANCDDEKVMCQLVETRFLPYFDTQDAVVHKRAESVLRKR